MAAAQSPEHAAGCLFCKRRDGGFSSCEHVLAESLGNTEHILGPGIVCDRCNNGPLARLDSALVNFPPVALLRAERGVPTKAGGAATSRWTNGTVYFAAPGHLVVESNSRRTTERMSARGGKINLTSGVTQSPRWPSRMSRSIWKSLLEFVYLDHGPKIAYDRRFDDLREMVLGTRRATGWLAIPKAINPHDHIRLTYDLRAVEDELTVPVVLDVFGIELATQACKQTVGADELWGEGSPPVNTWTFPCP